MRKLLSIFGLALAVASCTPPEVDYCRATGASPAQLDQCTQHYYQEEAAFKSDLRFCSAQADQTYPQSLYSGWGTARVHGGIGLGGQWRSAQSYTTPPDYQKNDQLDALRSRIIDPCMQDRGWNSGRSWEDGRRVKTSQMQPNGSGMPWLTK